ncbi:MAG: Hpt domain-containing protein [Desulfotalea sp.]
MEWDRVQALESVDGDEELLNDIMCLFRDTMLADLGKIEIGIKRESCMAVLEAAHSIRGAALVLGLQEIVELAKSLEKESKSGIDDVSINQYIGLQALYQEVVVETEQA